jgi:hypothetical protein
MRSLLPIVFLLFGGSWTAALAQDRGEADSNIACVERLQMPAYSPLASAARVQGTITVSVPLSAAASPERVTTESTGETPTGLRLLVPSIESAIKGATFRSNCGGKTVTLVFRFQIEGKAVDNPKTSLAFGFPNRFWITTQEPAFTQ